MRFAVCTIAYNEEEYIGACVKSWSNIVDKHLVLVSALPWNGDGVKRDRTASIADDAGASVIKDFWATEAEQRNYGLEQLQEFDFVLIVDPDEFYTPEDQETIMTHLERNAVNPNYRMDRNTPAFRIETMVTYWKTPWYVFDPPDAHKPYIAVDPKHTRFTEHRQVDAHRWIGTIPVTCHHFSWVKSDKKIKEKIQSFSHAKAIKDDWYEGVWRAWEPGSDMVVRPYGEQSRAVYSPAPGSVLRMLEK